MKRAAVLAALALFAAAPAWAQTSEEALYQKGNEMYRAGKFADAAISYKKAIEAGEGGAALYYNLGNAELRQGKLGPAIANYLRAQKLAPRDADVAYNLEYARGMIKTKLPDLPRGPFAAAASTVLNYLSANEWTTIALVSWWFAVLAAAVSVYARGEKLRPAAAWTAAAMLAALVFASPFAAVRVHRDYFTPRAVVIVGKVPARSGPGEDNAALFDLFEGMDVKVGQCENSWCRVSTGGFIGWVPGAALERL